LFSVCSVCVCFLCHCRCHCNYLLLTALIASILYADVSLTSSEAATKNTELTDPDDPISNEKLGSLTMPLNGTIPGAGNIYSATPLSNGSSNKHVTWRPETPPSPPPNVYTVSVMSRVMALTSLTCTILCFSVTLFLSLSSRFLLNLFLSLLWSMGVY